MRQEFAKYEKANPILSVAIATVFVTGQYEERYCGSVQLFSEFIRPQLKKVLVKMDQIAEELVTDKYSICSKQKYYWGYNKYKIRPMYFLFPEDETPIEEFIDKRIDLKMVDAVVEAAGWRNGRTSFVEILQYGGKDYHERHKYKGKRAEMEGFGKYSYLGPVRYGMKIRKYDKKKGCHYTLVCTVAVYKGICNYFSLKEEYQEMEAFKKLYQYKEYIEEDTDPKNRFEFFELMRGEDLDQGTPFESIKKLSI